MAISTMKQKRMTKDSSDKKSYVYIMTNKANHVFYTGVTSDLLKRVWQHKEGTCGAFTTGWLLSRSSSRASA